MEEEGNAINKILANNRERSCPKMRFFDSESVGQDVIYDPVLDPVLKAKTTILDKNKESYSKENLTTSELLRRDLKNYARSAYNLVVENVPVFVGEFNNMYPGFVNILGLQAILDNAERLHSRGWK